MVDDGAAPEHLPHPGEPDPRSRRVPPVRLARGSASGVVVATRLDASQREAVRARGRLVRVLGAPGTGKTTVAAHAVLDRVHDGTITPQQALVLAPTRMAATRLRHALTSGLAATTSSPLVSSIQAFAYGVLRRDAAERGEPTPRLLSGPEQDVVLRELLEGHEAGAGRRPDWPGGLEDATRTRGFRAELRDLLMRAVEHGLDPEALADLARREGRPEWGAAAQVLAEYDEVTALSTPGGYDPAWILTAAADLLEDDPGQAARVHDEIRLIVVDDAQELTAPAARLLRLMRSAAGEVVLVGDPDAATQTFRGADPRLMMDEPATSTIVLRHGHRLPTRVAEVAARTTARIGATGSVAHRLGRPAAPELPAPAAAPPAQAESDADPQLALFDLPGVTSPGSGTVGGDADPVAPGASTAGSGSGTGEVEVGPEDDPGEVATAVLGTAAAEARYIAARLRHAHLLEGIPWSRMAVLVRGAGRSATMRRVLAGDGVPVDVPGARVPLREEAAVRPLLTLFAAALDLAQERSQALAVEDVLDLLASPLGGTDSLATRRLVRALRQAELRRIEAAAQAAGQDVRALGADSPEPVPSAQVAARAVDGPAESAGVDRPRSSDELLVAAVHGDPVLDHLEDSVGVRGLRRLRRVLAAGVAAARRTGDTWAPGVTAETVLWAMWEATELAEPWRRAALSGSRRADRDLDAVVALTDAAARYVDRLPLRGPDGFLDHVRGQDVAGDTLVARAPGDDCVTLTTPAGAAGLEWDLVVVAGVQEGVWPDLRLRGSVLGSAALVDTLTGRGLSPSAARRAVLSDEARLFLVAVTRTRRSLLVTAVRNEDEAPSPFLDLVDRPDGPRPYAAPPPPMTLADAAAALRRRLAGAAMAAGDGSGPGPDDRRAAELLARLARAGVPGAAPRDWWGLRGVSDGRPRRGDGERISVSPSKVEAFAQCELRWFLGASGGQAGGGGIASAVGTLVHDIAATTDNADHAALVAELDRRWGELDLPDGWVARRRREDAEKMLDRLHRQHLAAQAAGWEVVGAELDVQVPLGRAVVRGRVDRLERDAQGRLRVVDLKTGSSKPATADLPTHPQLGAYQVAVESGAFGAHGQESAGAALMQIGKGGGVGGALQEQQPLAASDDPGWARTLLVNTADGMAGSTFRARAGTWCRTCDSRFSCPIQPEGEALR